MMARSAPLSAAAFRVRSRCGTGVAATTGGLSPRMSFQSQALTCGSRSIRTTSSPQATASTARLIAVVVLDVPPFWQTRETTFIATILLCDKYTFIVLDIWQAAGRRRAIRAVQLDAETIAAKLLGGDEGRARTEKRV